MAKTTIIAQPGKQEVFETRVFDAPRELVFKLYMDPNLRSQWWGPASLTTQVEVMDVRPGGIWRIVQHDPEGNEFGFHGVFHLIDAPARVVQTFEFEGMPGHVLLETVLFEALDGKTKLTAQSVFQSVEDRDGMIQSGMEQGSSESMDRLQTLLMKA